MNLETLITIGYYVSSIGFLIATIITAITVKKLGKSTLGSIFSYLLVGAGTFFVITIFQKLGGEFFMISDESMDVWWHIMFYLAVFSYFFGFRSLVSLGSGDDLSRASNISPMKWGIFSLIVLVLVFVLPASLEPTINAYSASNLSQLGLHHFLSFILAGVVASYLFNAKKNLGQIGRTIANPMIIAIGALCVQHFWELLTESWKVIDITSENIEGVEKIFLIIAAISVTYVALKLKAFAEPKQI